MQKFDKYWPYLRYYNDQKEFADFSWWYCLNDGEVYETLEIYDRFGFSTKDEICNSGTFFEFCKVDILNLKRQFIKIVAENENRKLLFLLDDDFDIAFNRYLDSHDLWGEWYVFEKENLQKELIVWCKKRNIPILG